MAHVEHESDDGVRSDADSSAVERDQPNGSVPEQNVSGGEDSGRTVPDSDQPVNGRPAEPDNVHRETSSPIADLYSESPREDDGAHENELSRNSADEVDQPADSVSGQNVPLSEESHEEPVSDSDAAESGHSEPARKGDEDAADYDTESEFGDVLDDVGSLIAELDAVTSDKNELAADESETQVSDLSSTEENKTEDPLYAAMVKAGSVEAETVDVGAGTGGEQVDTTGENDAPSEVEDEVAIGEVAVSSEETGTIEISDERPAVAGVEAGGETEQDVAVDKVAVSAEETARQEESAVEPTAERPVGVESEVEPASTDEAFAETAPPAQIEEETGEPDEQGATEPIPAEAPAGHRRGESLLSPRVLTSVVVGIVAGLLTYTILSMYIVTSPETLALRLGEHETPAESLARARELIEDGVSEQALALLNRAIDRTEPSSDMFDMLYLAATLDDELAGSSPDGATLERIRSRYEDALAEDPGNESAASALHRLGVIYIKQRDYRAARDRFQEVVDRFPEYADLDGVRISIAESYYMEGMYNAAERQLVNIIPSGLRARDRVQAEVLLGRVLEAEGKTDSAERVYRRIAEQNPGTESAATVTERLANIAANRGDYDTAAGLFETLIGQMPDASSNDRLVLKLATTYYAQKDYMRAESRCRELMELFPDSEYVPGATALLSRALAARDRLAEAEQIALEGSVRFPDNAEIVEVLADLCFDRADFENARTYYAQSVRLDPERLSARFRLGESAMELDEFDTAIAEYSAVARAEPVRGRLQYDANLRLADAYVAIGDVESAVDSLLSYLTEFATLELRKPLLKRLASVYHEFGLDADAARVYEQIAGSNTADGALIDAAEAYAAAGEWSRARKLLQRADIEGMPPHTAYKALVLQARLVRRIGDLRGAADRLAEAHARYPEARTLVGMSELLDAYLADNKEASARALVKEAKQWARINGSGDVFAAGLYTRWGDYLFAQGDYKSAAEVFVDIAADSATDEETREWARYQHANCMFGLERYAQAEQMYKQFTADYEQSAWRKAAEAKIEFGAIERQLRGSS